MTQKPNQDSPEREQINLSYEHAEAKEQHTHMHTYTLTQFAYRLDGAVREMTFTLKYA